MFNIANNLKALGYEPQIDLKPLEPVVKHFTEVAKRDGLPIGKPMEYDESMYQHQVPGGMISNMRHQLKIVGKEHLMSAAGHSRISGEQSSIRLSVAVSHVSISTADTVVTGRSW